MVARPHPDAGRGLVALGEGGTGVREQTLVKGDSMFGLFRARLDELAAALKAGSPESLAVARARVTALLRMRELPAERAAKRVTEIEAAIASGVPPERLVPTMPSRSATIAALITDTSLTLSRAVDPQQAQVQRARGVLLAALEACGLDPEQAQRRAGELVSAWTK
jgi:hypothetical protein